MENHKKLFKKNLKKNNFRLLLKEKLVAFITALGRQNRYLSIIEQNDVVRACNVECLDPKQEIVAIIDEQ